MKDDNGRKWEAKDYIYAIILTSIIGIIILLPVFILIVIDYFTGWKYHWYVWGVLFIIITLSALFSKQISNKIGLYKGMKVKE